MGKTLRPAYELAGPPQLVIVDGAGTLFDPGSVVPAYAFEAAFEEKGLHLEIDMIMKYMGRPKREHVALLLREPSILDQFRSRYGRDVTDEDIDAVYHSSRELLYRSAAKTEEIQGVKDAAFRLKESGVPLVVTTGYDRRMIDETRSHLTWLDEVIDAYVTNSDVPEGRPAPFMIYRAMEVTRVKNPSYAVSIGDTKADVESSDNAHMPGVLVTSGSITDTQAAEAINEETGRNHLVVLNLANAIEYILDGSLVERIAALNR